MELSKETIQKLEELKESLPPVIEKMKEMCQAEHLTDEETKWLSEMEQQIKTLLPYIRLIENDLSGKIYGAAVTYYYSVKEQAAKGNSKAQAILNDLKPLFRDSLNEQIDSN